MLGKFTSLFYKPDGTPTDPEVPEAPAAPKASASKPVTTVAATPVARVAPPLPGQIDPEMAKILEDAILEANIPGFDYIEFRDVLANMANIGLPEPKLFQAAFASAQIAKVTKPQLLEAIDYYLKVIATKGHEFHNYVAGLAATDISGKDQTISDLDKLNEQDAAQIQKLTAAIGERRRQQDQLRMEKAQADLDIKNKTSAFEATQLAIVERLNSDRNKINTYIQ
ncbi:hypothetical protein M0R72_00180 [Candidatus Pacearchaeota archaeon]|nr:hypothetical protein [Candidatus Pacearchaeota archaeon]